MPNEISKITKITNKTVGSASLSHTASSAPCVGEKGLDEKIVTALKTVYDPEIAVNIYDLGLIYGLNIDGKNNVHVSMTLTTPNCPVAETFPIEVETRVREVEGTNDVTVEVVFEPPWTQDMMSDDAKLELGFILDL